MILQAGARVCCTLGAGSRAVEYFFRMSESRDKQTQIKHLPLIFTLWLGLLLIDSMGHVFGLPGWPGIVMVPPPHDGVHTQNQTYKASLLHAGCAIQTAPHWETVVTNTDCHRPSNRLAA